ncbi:MAG TPA: hypothetical protein VFU88_22110 [Ktedonobacterales bacterium]|nr:hypothetical protein [Ktedonobacterales bacterium]
MATRQGEQAALGQAAEQWEQPRADAPRVLRVRSASGVWLARALPPVLLLLYIGFWAVTSLQNMNETDLDAFFLPSVQIALAGHPLHIYQTRYYTIYPNANGPLSMLPLTLVAWVAARLGWLGDVHLRRMLVDAVFAVFPLLLGREALLALDRLLPARPAGLWRWLALACFVLTPELWHSVLLYGHIEQPIMIWLVLWAVRALGEGHAWRGGLLLGLALLTRTTALLYLLPLTLTLLLRGERAAAVKTAAVAAGTAVLGLLPFWLADPRNLTYSLVTFRGVLPIGGGSFWLLASGTPLESFAQRDDGLVVAVAASLVTLLTLLLRRDLSVRSRDMYALLAISGLCFPLLLKTLWPYYYLDVSIFLTLWWLGAAPSRRTWDTWLHWLAGATAPLAAIGIAELSELVYSSVLNQAWTVPWSLAVGLATFALLAAICAVLWQRRASTPDDETTGAAAGPLERGATALAV